MPILKILPFLLTLLLPLLPSWAQAPAGEQPARPEPLYVHLDKPFYTSGETMWYKVYLLRPAGAGPSQVVYVDLVGSGDKVVMQQKLKVESGQAHGDFTLPLDVEEGPYAFRSYTRWNLNFDPKYSYSQQVPVYNEWKKREAAVQPALAEAALPLAAEPPAPASPGEMQLQLTTNKPVYSRNEKVTLTLQVTDGSGRPVKAQLSVAVVDQTLVSGAAGEAPVSMAERQREVRALPPGPVRAGLPYAPEKGLVLRGRIPGPQLPDFGSTMFAVFTPAGYRFITTQLVENRLEAPLPDFYTPKIIHLHSLSPGAAAIPPVAADNLGTLLPAPSLAPLPEPTPQLQEYLYQSRLRRKFSELFREEEPGAAPQPEAAQVLPGLRADKTYEMKDFKALEDVEDFIRAFGFKATFVEENGANSLRLYSPDAKIPFREKPWYIVDGYLIRDERLVLQIPMRNLKRVELFYKRKTLLGQFEPSMLRSGVVALYTNDKELLLPALARLSNLTAQGYTQPRTFEVPQQQDQPGRAPDFRPLLFWHPTLRTDPASPTTVTFPTADAISGYRVRVEGLSESGQAISGSTTFKVSFGN